MDFNFERRPAGEADLSRRCRHRYVHCSSTRRELSRLLAEHQLEAHRFLRRALVVHLFGANRGAVNAVFLVCVPHQQRGRLLILALGISRPDHERL